jgi:hypothetical protein
MLRMGVGRWGVFVDPAGDGILLHAEWQSVTGELQRTHVQQKFIVPSVSVLLHAWPLSSKGPPGYDSSSRPTAMSFLDLPRLTFAGQFQADVSTVNNDPRHFDNARFVTRFQEFQTKTTQNGWWNPIGTGIFRFSGCRVQAAIGPGGAGDDPLVGFHVGNSPDLPSGKIVDIDPDWQLASQLYGLAVSLVEPRTGKLVLLGDFEPAPFRDLWFTRGGGAGDSGASAMWQSRLTNLRWDLDGVTSPVLHALAGAARASGQLSIRITTYAYQTGVSKPTFTYGTVLGAIGPVRADEPTTFIAGRRFMPNGANCPPGACMAANGMTCFSAKVIGRTLVADLSNALPLDKTGQLAALGNLQVALLRQPDVNESSLVGSNDYVSLGALDVSDKLMQVQSGIQTFAIPEFAFPDIARRPLALVLVGADPATTAAQVMMREQPEGRDVRVDDVSFRLDPNAAGLNVREVPIYATRYGEPLAGAGVTFQPGPPTPDVGDSPTDQTLGTTPTATIPITNDPIGILGIEPPVVMTDATGRAIVRIAGPARMGTPRSYIDGQLYSIPYNFVSSPAIMQTFDQVSVLVFSSFTASDEPTWAEVQPILQQYANLYPIMSKGLFDFSKQAIADANAHLLHFVLSKQVTDPDYMPVTRDLSAGKRAALLRYLERVMARSTIHRPDSEARYASRCPFSGVTPTERPEDVPNKIIFHHLRSR